MGGEFCNKLLFNKSEGEEDCIVVDVLATEIEEEPVFICDREVTFVTLLKGKLCL